MRSLCITRAPTVSLSVAPPGGVLSLTGLTAVAVPTCWASAGAATSSAAVNGNTMNFPVMTRPVSACSANDRHLAADHRGGGGLKQRRCAEIELADMGVDRDSQDETGAHQSEDHDLHVGPAISAIDRMIHSRLRILPSFKRHSRTKPVTAGTKRRFPL